MRWTKITKNVTLETVEVNTVNINMKFALVINTFAKQRVVLKSKLVVLNAGAIHKKRWRITPYNVLENRCMRCLLNSIS